MSNPRTSTRCIAIFGLVSFLTGVTDAAMAPNTIPNVSATGHQQGDSANGDGSIRTAVDGTGLTIGNPLDSNTWTHSTIWQDDWQGSANPPSLGWMVLDLGANRHNLDTMYIWNVNEATATNRGTKDFDLYYATNPTVTPPPISGSTQTYNFSSGGWTLHSNVTNVTQGGTNISKTVDVSDILKARYLGLDILTDHGAGWRPGFAEVQVASHLIGYWSFDDQAASTEDLSVNDNHGALNGGANYVAGHTGAAGDYAINFDGTDDFVNTGTSLLNNLSQFTAAGWAVFDADGGARGLWGQNDAVEFGSTTSNDRVDLWSERPGGPQLSTPNGSVSVDGTTWHHIAIWGNGSERRIYIDGVQQAIATHGAQADYGDSTYNFNIGGGGIWGASGNWFDGRIDDVAVWNIALEEHYIQRLAAGTVTPLTIPEPSTFALGAIGLFGLLGWGRRKSFRM